MSECVLELKNHYLQNEKGTSQGREVLAEIKTHSAQTDLWKHQKESHGPSGQCKNSFLLFHNTNKQFMQGNVLQLQCLPRQKELHASPIFFWHTTSFFWIFYQQDHHNKKQISSSQPNSCHGQNHLLREMLQTFTPVTEQFVLEILQKSVPKSCDLDPISAKNCCTKTSMFSSLQSPISSTLHWLLVLYHQTSKLLLSNPCSKKPPSTKMYWKNYRPISNLPFLSRILEKIVLHKLLAHLQENNLCNYFQSAYRTGHSTETALLRVVNDFLNAMNEAKIFVLLLLDLSAAFNTIDHHILLSRLKTAFGIRSTALQWFRSYLLDINQCVVVNNSSFSTSPLMFGVP